MTFKLHLLKESIALLKESIALLEKRLQLLKAKMQQMTRWKVSGVDMFNKIQS